MLSTIFGTILWDPISGFGLQKRAIKIFIQNVQKGVT
jgi:hypothetical protein